MHIFGLHRSAEKGDLERVRRLVEGGVSVDSRDAKGRTPLHWAAERGLCEVVDFLSSLPGCDLNPMDPDGRTPLLLAAIRGEQHVVHLLLQRGAQVNCAADNKYTLLHRASQNGWTDLVRHILDRGGVDLNAVTECGDTPLLLAAGSGHEDIAALLIRAGAGVVQRNVDRRTALHDAAWCGRPRVVQMLLEEEGLNLDPRDGDGDTPLHEACRWGCREVVKQLLVAGADTTLMNDRGETALSEGIRRRRLTMEDIRLFVQHGAFVQDCDYVHISQNPVLRENILKNVGLCTQSIVNKFHHHSLPALDSISYFTRKLPRVDKFKLNARQIDEVENLVKGEIERKGFCNVVKVHPTALSALCVLSLITCQSGTKRYASPDFDGNNSPFKKILT